MISALRFIIVHLRIVRSQLNDLQVRLAPAFPAQLSVFRSQSRARSIWLWIMDN